MSPSISETSCMLSNTINSRLHNWKNSHSMLSNTTNYIDCTIERSNSHALVSSVIQSTLDCTIPITLNRCANMVSECDHFLLPFRHRSCFHHLAEKWWYLYIYIYACYVDSTMNHTDSSRKPRPRVSLLRPVPHGVLKHHLLNDSAL